MRRIDANKPEVRQCVGVTLLETVINLDRFAARFKAAARVQAFTDLLARIIPKLSRIFCTRCDLPAAVIDAAADGDLSEVVDDARIAQRRVVAHLQHPGDLDVRGGADRAALADLRAEEPQQPPPVAVPVVPAEPEERQADEHPQRPADLGLHAPGADLGSFECGVGGFAHGSVPTGRTRPGATIVGPPGGNPCTPYRSSS